MKTHLTTNDEFVAHLSEDRLAFMEKIGRQIYSIRDVMVACAFDAEKEREACKVFLEAVAPRPATLEHGHKRRFSLSEVLSLALLRCVENEYEVRRTYLRRVFAGLNPDVAPDAHYEEERDSVPEEELAFHLSALAAFSLARCFPLYYVLVTHPESNILMRIPGRPEEGAQYSYFISQRRFAAELGNVDPTNRPSACSAILISATREIEGAVARLRAADLSELPEVPFVCIPTPAHQRTRSMDVKWPEQSLINDIRGRSGSNGRKQTFEVVIRHGQILYYDYIETHRPNASPKKLFSNSKTYSVTSIRRPDGRVRRYERTVRKHFVENDKTVGHESKQASSNHS